MNENGLNLPVLIAINNKNKNYYHYILVNEHFNPIFNRVMQAFCMVELQLLNA